MSAVASSSSPTPFAAAAVWSKAPADILLDIIGRLPIGDFIRFGAVCVSWRKILLERRRRPVHFRWLHLRCHGIFNGTVRVFSLAENREYRIELPEMFRRHRCIGSSEGWLVLADEIAELHMFDPVSGTHLRLPTVTTISDFTSVSRGSKGQINGYFMDRHNDGKTIFLAAEVLQHTYFAKVILSRSFTAAAICRIADKLAFTRAVGENSTWITVKLPGGFVTVDDIVFFREQLYAVTCSGLVVVYDLSDVPTVTQMIQPPSWNSSGTNGSHRYLVESSDGHLLQVCRPRKLSGTVVVGVFMMMVDPAGDNWAELKSLGDDALFLGHSHSVALSTQRFPELRRNCIYFTDKLHLGPCDLQVYNMENRTFYPLAKSGVTESILYWADFVKQSKDLKKTDGSNKQQLNKVYLNNLELDLLKLDNKLRFIFGVANDEIAVLNRKIAIDLFLELQWKGFTPFPKKDKSAGPAIAGASEEVGKGVRASDYEYLLSMPIISFGVDTMTEFCAEKDKLYHELEEERNATLRMKE